MHIKFIDRGSGRGSDAIDYILSEQDHTKQPRPYPPKVLRGNPKQVATLADSLTFSKKYSSAVISFHPDDKPTSEQIKEVLNGFERVAFAGLEHDQYTYTAALHREKESEHIHIIIPRVELSTGKSFNPAPPGWQKDFDPLRDHYNEKYSWKTPDISLKPENARITQPELDALRCGTRAEIKKTIEQYLLSEAEEGNIENREDIIESLQSIGFEIPRQGKNYITIHDTESNTRIRLKGAIYEQHWRPEQTLEAENSSETERDRNTDEARARTAYSELENRISKRAEYNQQRYPKAESKPTTRTHRNKKQKSEPSKRSEKNDDTGLDQAKLDSDNSLSDYLHKQLRTDALHINAHPEPNNTDRKKRKNIKDTEKSGQLDKIQQVQREIMRPDRQERTSLPRWLHDLKKRLRIEAEYDRARAEFNNRIRKFIESIQAGYDKFRKADQELKRASSELSTAERRTYQAIQPSGQTLRRGIRTERENRADELEQFKTEINLVEYAARLGYRIDKDESTKNSKSMRLNDDKIIITTDEDGHGIYFSARDTADNGSIIDFVQKRKELNLGQVRKELRAFRGFTDVQDYRAYTKPKPVDKNTAQVAYYLAQADFTDSHPYLVHERSISSDTLKDNRFSRSVKIDNRGNAIFTHYNGQGISGYEIKNHDFTGFAKGGKKGVWYSSNIMRAKRIVIVESAIDALSHAELKQTSEETAYVSIAGSMSASQLELIKKVVNGKKVIIATDNDKSGEHYAEQIKEVNPDAVRETAHGKDWNEDLKVKRELNSDRELELY